MELLVQLRTCGANGSGRSNGHRRRVAEDLHAFQEKNASYVAECVGKIRRLLPPDVTIRSLPNLNVLVVSVPAQSQAESVRRRIVNACPEIANISDDLNTKAAGQRK